MKYTVWVCFLFWQLLGFGAEATSPTKLWKMEPADFFNTSVAQQKIDLAQPDNYLFSIAVFQATNLIRSQHDRHALLPTRELYYAARSHIDAMHQYQFFDHENPVNADHRTFSQRITLFGSNYQIMGENLARVTPFKTDGGHYSYQKMRGKYHYFDTKGRPLQVFTYGELAKYVVANWYASEGHRKNMMAREFSYVGVAGVILPTYGQSARLPDVYAVQEFGGYLF